MNPSLPPIVVIAGVGSGLGAALAHRFVRGGCRVALLARTPSFIAQLAEELNAARKGAAISIPTDLTDQQSISQAFLKIRQTMGPVHYLVNHASGGSGSFGKGCLELNLQDFENAWKVGVMGALLCSREAAGDMLKNPQPIGTLSPGILFSGATSSVRGASIAFSSAKFGTRGLAQSLARELWPKGIHVAHVVIDGVIAEPAGPVEVSVSTEENPLMDASAIAESYWFLANQHRSAWTLELDVRPNFEKFFE